MKIMELVQNYVKERGLAPATVVHYEFIARAIERDLNIIHIEDITRDRMLEWKQLALEKKLRPETWNNYLRHTRILTNYAFDQQILESKPKMNFLKLPDTTHKPKILTEIELREIMAYLRSEECKAKPSWFWGAVIKTLFFTGMRRRQLTGMQWNHLNLNESALLLPLGTSKTGREWVIPLSESVCQELYNIREKTIEVLPENVKLKKQMVFDISLFNERFHCDQGLTPQALSSFFNRLSDWTGISISAHRLRHTCATELAKHGRYKELQELLGHSRVDTTLMYIHPPINQIRTLVNTLPEIDNK